MRKRKQISLLERQRPKALILREEFVWFPPFRADPKTIADTFRFCPWETLSVVFGQVPSRSN